MSSTIHTPTLSNVNEDNDNKAEFTIEPLHTGYGMTLGNSLRRVLLSSIEGAAVIGFRVDGVTHEFTTIKGVKEDVVEIMLNIKQLRVKVHSDERQTIRLEKKGKGAVTAKDIKESSEVEVVNKDLTIATIDDDKTSLVIDIIVEKGRGYRPVEIGKNNTLPADYIGLDAVFSPILRVRYSVSNTRVGQITNLDKLLLSIETDGSLTAKDAFEEANAILITQYEALAGQTRLPQGTPFASIAEEEEEETELNTSIDDLNLSARTTNALLNNEINTIKDLVTLSDSELRDLKGFGNKALDEVREKLSEMDL